jgi:glycosyltransferase involved in cell wall biosynthesis
LRVLVAAGFTESLINFREALLREMVERGHEVHASGPERVEKVLRRLRQIGVHFHQLPMQRTGMNPVRDLHSLASYLRLVRDIKPDVVLAYTIKPVVYGLLAARMAGVARRYALITGLGSAFAAGPALRHMLVRKTAIQLYRAGLNRAAGVFFQNPDDCRTFVDSGLIGRDVARFVVNGSGVDLQYFGRRPVPRNGGFLLVARLLADKGVREYVAAARLLKQRHPETRCCLVGPFDSNPSAIKPADVDAWVKEGVVDYVGPMDDVRPALEQCSVFVLPSYGEGHPRTVMEAMSTGRAVITTDVPGCRETVEPGVTGFLVPPRDPEALAAKMLDFVEDPTLAERMGEQARVRAEARYDVRLINAAMLDAMGL